MTRAKDYTGMERGRLRAIEDAGYSKGKRRVWKFQCSCGNVCYYGASEVFQTRPNTLSCGCKKREQIAAINAAGLNLPNLLKGHKSPQPAKRWLSQLRAPNGRFAPRGYVSKRVFKFMED